MIIRRLGIVLLSLGMVFSVSCTKNMDEDLGTQEEPSSTPDAKVPYGTYEGEWKLSKYGLKCSGRIEVSNNRIDFEMPADYLIPRLDLVNEKTKAAYPDEPFFNTTSDYMYYNTQQVMLCSTQGYSSEANYIELTKESLDNQPSSQGKNVLSLSAKVNDVEYEIRMYAIKEQPTAVFDMNVGLWTMAIPIDVVVVHSTKTGTDISSAYLDEKTPDKSAWLFVFRATRKII